jgi:hypothetical protein
MYIDWDPSRHCKYRPVWNGGSFNLKGTEYEFETLNSLLKFFEFFASEKTCKQYKDAIGKMNITI